MENFGNWLLNFVNSYIVSFGVHLICAVLILFIGFKLSNVLVKQIKKAKGYQKLDVNIQSFCGNVLSVLLKICVVIAVVNVIGVPDASLLAVIGSCGVTIGLALQGGLSNIASGVVIMLCRPFHVGDFIVSGAISGVVKDIGLYYTTLVTPDNQDVVIPNSTLSNSTTVNWSVEKTRRIDFDFNVSYRTDLDLARKVLLAAAQNNDLVLHDPAPEVFVASHGESGLGIRLRVWCATENYWTVNFDMYEDVKKAFDQFEIEIPYPQVTVHMSDRK